MCIPRMEKWMRLCYKKISKFLMHLKWEKYGKETECERKTKCEQGAGQKGKDPFYKGNQKALDAAFDAHAGCYVCDYFLIHSHVRYCQGI